MDIEADCEKIINDLDVDYFHKGKKKKSIKIALKSILTHKDLGYQTSKISECFEEFWRKYSNEHLATVLKNFPKVEAALYGLLREGPERYRDHYIHMFNNFIFGGQILSIIKRKCSEGDLEKLFKIEKESIVPVAFSPYSSGERLLFIWALITNFHDVAVPIERIKELIKGLNNYLCYFGYNIPEFNLANNDSLVINAHKYLEIMAALFTDGIIPKDGIYDTTFPPNPYVYKAFCDAFDNRDQGVLAAIGLFKNIQDTFFQRKDKFALKFEEYPLYYQRVLTQDIARAALSIALHNFKPKEFPKLFPIKFNKLPITFIFILCDEIQEFMRPEGLSYFVVTKLKNWPKLVVDITPDKRIRISVDLSYKQPKELFVILKQVAPYLEEKKKAKTPFTSKEVLEAERKKDVQTGLNLMDKYIREYWNERAEILKSKLDFRNDGIIGLDLKIEIMFPEKEINQTHHFGWKPK